MKKHLTTKLMATLFLLSMTGAFHVLGETDDYQNDISKYKSWLKVTPRPHEVKATLGALDWDATIIIGDDKKSRNAGLHELQLPTQSAGIPDPLEKFRASIKPAAPGVYGEVYINEIAAKAVKANKFVFTHDSNKTAGKNFRFPTGSIIVREKILAGDKSTESLAVMIKRDSSFNPQSNGWQFLYLDPKTLAITKDDQATCLSCHKLTKETDFVFKSYQP